jgi:phage terminase large subunit-like protein
MMLKEGKAYQYAQWCLEDGNSKVGKYIKKQAQAWIEIADGKSNEAYVDEKAYNKMCKILKLMVHPDLQCSMYDGLEDYAWFLNTAIFCTKLTNDKELDIRYYITALLEISRKNFKTFNSAVIFILLMLTDPKFSRFFSVAPDLKLSSELKIAIRKIIKVSPALADDDVFKILRSEVRCLLTESEYTPLAYSEDKMDGKLANAFLADEAGAMDSYPIEAMRSSQITLFNKLGIIISTQYPNDNNVMIDEIDISKKVLDGLIDNKRRFSLLYEPDDEFLVNEQWQTEDLIIYQSNPVAVSNDYIFEAIKDMRINAILYENKRENYLCKHNNIKYKGLGVEGFIDITKVRECKIEENLDFWKGRRVYLGLDLSQTDDNTSVAMVTEEDGMIYAKVWGFIPRDKKLFKTKKENVDYNKLISMGVCLECGDEVIDYGFVENFIMNLEQKYGVEIIQIGYDRWNALSTVQKLEAAGYLCVEIKQHSSVLHPPTKLLKELVLRKHFRYDENLMLEINFQNARCTEDTNLNKYVNKKRSEGKVDMVVSTINAIYLLAQDIILNPYADWGAMVI